MRRLTHGLLYAVSLRGFVRRRRRAPRPRPPAPRSCGSSPRRGRAPARRAAPRRRSAAGARGRSARPARSRAFRAGAPGRAPAAASSRRRPARRRSPRPAGPRKIAQHEAVGAAPAAVEEHRADQRLERAGEDRGLLAAARALLAPAEAQVRAEVQLARRGRERRLADERRPHPGQLAFAGRRVLPGEVARRRQAEDRVPEELQALVVLGLPGGPLADRRAVGERGRQQLGPPEPVPDPLLERRVIAGRGQGSNFLKTTEALAPPNPKVFDSTLRDRDPARRVRHVVQVALGVGVLEVDRRRDDAVLDREHGGDRLDAAGRAEQVPGHRLGRADRDAPGVLAEDRLDRLGLDRVVELRRGAVRVDVVDLRRRRARRRGSPGACSAPRLRRPARGRSCGRRRPSPRSRRTRRRSARRARARARAPRAR